MKKYSLFLMLGYFSLEAMTELKSFSRVFKPTMLSKYYKVQTRFYIMDNGFAIKDIEDVVEHCRSSSVQTFTEKLDFSNRKKILQWVNAEFGRCAEQGSEPDELLFGLYHDLLQIDKERSAYLKKSFNGFDFVVRWSKEHASIYE
jgi:hypothetical protein